MSSGKTEEQVRTASRMNIEAESPGICEQTVRLQNHMKKQINESYQVSRFILETRDIT